MLDLPLGSALLDALPAHCQLVLVGGSSHELFRVSNEIVIGFPWSRTLLEALLAQPAGAC